MIGNYKGKMLDVVSRLEDDLQPLEDDLQITEDDLQTKEDDFYMKEYDQNLLFPFNYKDWPNPFKCFETVGIMKGDDTWC